VNGWVFSSGCRGPPPEWGLGGGVVAVAAAAAAVVVVGVVFVVVVVAAAAAAFVSVFCLWIVYMLST
jgi:hypothetical protein